MIGASAAALAEPPAKVGDELVVGANPTGEARRLRLQTSGKGRIPTQRLALLCDGWRAPSGELQPAQAVEDATAAASLGSHRWIRESLRPSGLAPHLDVLVEAMAAAPAAERPALAAKVLVITQFARGPLVHRAPEPKAARVASGDAATAAAARERDRLHGAA